MTAPIDFYFDLSSSYSDIALQAIDQIAARSGRNVVWHSIVDGEAFRGVDRLAQLEGWLAEGGF